MRVVSLRHAYFDSWVIDALFLGTGVKAFWSFSFERIVLLNRLPFVEAFYSFREGF